MYLARANTHQEAPAADSRNSVHDGSTHCLKQHTQTACCTRGATHPSLPTGEHITCAPPLSGLDTLPVSRTHNETKFNVKELQGRNRPQLVTEPMAPYERKTRHSPPLDRQRMTPLPREARGHHRKRNKNMHCAVLTHSGASRLTSMLLHEVKI